MSLIDRLLGIAGSPGSEVLTVDRIACTGHGVCARLLPDAITLDDWGYPILSGIPSDPALATVAVTLCPAAALRWRSRQPAKRYVSGEHFGIRFTRTRQ